MIVQDLITLAIPRTRRFSKRPFVGPASADTTCNRRLLNTDDIGPLSNASSMSAVCQEHIRSRVPSLLDLCRPSAVRDRVWTIGIHALDAMKRCRTSAHVVHEGLEGILPAWADADTAASVVLKTVVVRVVAPLFHVCPNDVFGRLAGSVFEVVGVQQACASTAARFRSAANQFIKRHGDVFSAIAATFKYTPSLVLDFSLDGQFGKALSRLHMNALHASDYSCIWLMGAM